MVYDPKKNEARRNKIKIFSSLNNPEPLGFNDIKRGTQLHQNTLDKWLTYFVGKGFVAGIGEKRKKYKITKKGEVEYKKLIAEENTEETLSNGKLLDSLTTKEYIKTETETSFCRGVSSFSKILNEEEKKKLEKGVNEELTPFILNFYNKYGITSGSHVVAFSPKKK